MEEKSELQKRIDFFIKTDDMKEIKRQNLVISSQRRENDAEHSWSLSMLAILLADYAVEKIQLERVLKMVTVHDLVELYAGDTFAYDSDGAKSKAQRESEAADKLFSMLPEKQGSEIRALWEEFDRMDSPDSRFAASCDRLQPLINNFYTNGHTWRLFGVSPESVYARNEVVKTAMPEVWEIVDRYITAAIARGDFDKK